MSEALDYLLRARPEAMKSYFRFLKQAGGSLDPKTRSLISVITKVAAQTESGLRQYLPRALHDGVTPEEVLDALLMAFPMLGLTRITWAVEIILDMDIPGFEPESLGREPSWHPLLPVNELPVGEIRSVQADGRDLLVYREAEEIRVYDGRCPHQVTRITGLEVAQGRITCPKHQWVFDVASGDCVKKGNRPLRRLREQVVDGLLLAYW